MQMPPKMRWILSLLVLTVPLLAYVVMFGPSVSTEHDRWGTFGSYISGIYTPLLTIATLLILRHQLNLQRQMHEHQYTQTYIQQARTDVEFYLGELGRVLHVAVGRGHTLGTFLEEAFAHATLEQLDNEDLKATARKTHLGEPRLVGLIHGLQQVLGGLTASNAMPFRLALVSGRQKAIALIGFPMLVALEHYERTLNEGKLRGPYFFSPRLSPDESIGAPNRI